MFLKKLVSEHQPIVVFYMGHHGKSMAIHALSHILEHVDQTFEVVESPKSLQSALSQAGTVSFVLSKKKPFPKLFLVHVSAGMSFKKEWLDLVKQKIVIVPWLSETELGEQSITAWIKEQCPWLTDYKDSTTLVVNQDIQGAREGIASLKLSDVLFYSAEHDSADISASNLSFIEPSITEDSVNTRIQGIRAKISYKGSQLPLQIHHGIGTSHLSSVLSAIPVIDLIDTNIIDALRPVRTYKPLPGRMRLIPGIKKTILVDNTYDNNVETMYHAIQQSEIIPLQEGAKKIAVIGELTKTGAQSVSVHTFLGQQLVQAGFDMIVAIGEQANDVLKGAEEAGMDHTRTVFFDNNLEAGKYVQRELKMNDVVLITGPKEGKLESIVKELMAFPLQAKSEILQR